MKNSYDFSKGVKNPYAKRLKKQVTIRLAEDTIGYFKAQGAKAGIPYQSLINLYLADCVGRQKKLSIHWG
jgi:predicted DNA binding CopG/RHH family protein